MTSDLRGGPLATEGVAKSMAVAGIDMGAQSTKAVILEGGRILAAVTLQTGESGEKRGPARPWRKALRQAHLKLERH